MIDDEEAPSYHKKLANMNNVKEKINLKKIEKKFEKMKNDKFAEYNRDEKELRNQLQRLTLEQEESRRELGDVRNFLREMKEADDHHTPTYQRGSIAKKGVSKILKRTSTATISQEPEEITSPLDAHQVALRLLEHQFSKDAARRTRPGATSTQTGTFHLTKRSEPGGLSKRPSKDNFGQASAPKLLSSTTKKPNSREESEVSVGSSIEEDVLSDNPAKSEWLRARKIGKTQSDVMSLSSPTPKLMTSLRKTGTTLDMSVPDEMDEEEYRDKMDLEALQRYYDLLNDKEKMNERDGDSSMALHATGTLSTFKRSQRRKVLALEALLKQLPSFTRKAQIPLSHKDALECRYLRMPQSTIRELEALCRQEGIDPGLHSHMTEDDVIAYLDGRPLPGSIPTPLTPSVRSSIHTPYKSSLASTPSNSAKLTSGSTSKAKVTTWGRTRGGGARL